MARKKSDKNRSRKPEPTDVNQWLNFAPDSYLERTSRAVYALLFLVPFIVVYEIGTMLINTNTLSQTQERVVAFVWLQDFLLYIGAGARFAWAAPPLVVIVILLAIQITSRKKWEFHPADLAPMTIESILLAVPLIVLSLMLNSSARPAASAAAEFNHTPAAVICSMAAEPEASPAGDLRLDSPVGSFLADIITGIGAGIYEELVFRLVLICLLMLFFQDVLRLPYKNSIVFSVIISAALFSLHHHVAIVSGQLSFGDRFDLVRFGFRTIAGVYFAVLFAVRGFGIAAGAHAFYDIIATILNTFVFTD